MRRAATTCRLLLHDPSCSSTAAPSRHCLLSIIVLRRLSRGAGGPSSKFVSDLGVCSRIVVCSCLSLPLYVFRCVRVPIHIIQWRTLFMSRTTPPPVHVAHLPFPHNERNQQMKGTTDTHVGTPSRKVEYTDSRAATGSDVTKYPKLVVTCSRYCPQRASAQPVAIQSAMRSKQARCCWMAVLVFDVSCGLSCARSAMERASAAHAGTLRGRNRATL